MDVGMVGVAKGSNLTKALTKIKASLNCSVSKIPSKTFANAFNRGFPYIIPEGS